MNKYKVMLASIIGVLLVLNMIVGTFTFQEAVSSVIFVGIFLYIGSYFIKVRNNEKRLDELETKLKKYEERESTHE